MEIVAGEYQNDNRINFIQNLDDIGQPFNCDQWSHQCVTDFMDIVNDGNNGQGDYFLFDLFALNQYWHNIIVLDHNMVYRNFISCYDYSPAEIEQELRNTIEQILLEMETNLGDINNDEILNIQDILSIINLILQNEYNFIGDMNSDNTLNVLDILSIVNIILN